MQDLAQPVSLLMNGDNATIRVAVVSLICLNYGNTLLLISLVRALQALGMDAFVLPYRHEHSTKLIKQAHYMGEGLPTTSSHMRSELLSEALDLDIQTLRPTIEGALHKARKTRPSIDVAILTADSWNWNNPLFPFDSALMGEGLTGRMPVIAYAASFSDSVDSNGHPDCSSHREGGHTAKCVSPRFLQSLGSLLGNIKNISLRDGPSRALVHNLTSTKPDVHVDSAFLWDGWQKLAKAQAEHNASNTSTHNQKLVTYTHGFPNSHMLSQLASDNKLERLDVSNGPVTAYKWLAAMDQAKLIITNTFHGLVFALLLNRPFWVCGPLPTMKQVKVKAMLADVGLRHRLIHCAKKWPKGIDLHQVIDFGRINEWIASQRNRSLTYLQSIADAVKGGRAKEM